MFTSDALIRGFGSTSHTSYIDSAEIQFTVNADRVIYLKDYYHAYGRSQTTCASWPEYEAYPAFLCYKKEYKGHGFILDRAYSYTTY